MNSYRETLNSATQMLKSRHFWRGAGDSSGRMLLTCLLAAIVFMLAGCGTRYLIQRPGTVGVLMQDVDATVSFPDKDGNLIPSTGTLPKGTLVNGPKLVEKEGKK